MAHSYGDTKYNKLQGLIRAVLNVKEPTDRRLQACSGLRTFALYPENAHVLAKSVDRVLPTLEQPLRDRVAEVRNAVARAIGCIGAAIIMRQEGGAFVHWAIQHLMDPKNRETIKASILLVIKEFVETADRKAVEPYAPGLILNVRTFIESLQQPELLLPSAEVLVVLCQTQGLYFQPHFQDVVDLLVGWALDVDISAKYCRALGELFAALQPMWAGPNLVFTFDLMSKFLVDMEALAEIQPFQMEHTERMLRFLSCFTAVGRGVGSQYFAEEIVNEFVSRVFKIFKAVSDKLYNKKWLIQAAETLFAFSQLFGDAFQQHVPASLQYLLEQMIPTPNASTVCKICEGILQMLRLQGPRIPTRIVDIIFESETLRSLRSSSNPTVSKAVRLIFEQFYQTTSEEVIERAVSYILSSLRQSYALLAASDRSQAQQRQLCQAIDLYMADVSLLVFAFLSGKLANAQRERLVQMLSEHHPIHNSTIASNPSIQLALLAAFRHMSTNHPHSVVLGPVARKIVVDVMASAVAEAKQPKSILFALKWLSTAAAQHASSSMTAGNNTASLASSYLLLSSRNQALNYVQANVVAPLSMPFVNTFFSLYSEARSLPLLRGILSAAASEDDTLRLMAAQVLAKIVQSDVFHSEALGQIAHTCVVRLGDINQHVRLAFRELLAAIGFSVVLSHSMTPATSDESIIKTRVMSAYPADALFRSHHFHRIINFFAQRGQETANDWLVRMYCASQAPSKLAEASKADRDPFSAGELFRSSDLLPTFWALWECARFCVLTRLRTPLGGPMQTFEALEKILIAYAAGNLALIPTLPNVLTHHNGSSGASHINLISRLPPRMLLLFIDHLEKQIYGAYEGSMTVDHHSNKAATAFFRTNQKVCTDWYARFRQSLIAVGAACNATMDTIRHSMKRLVDLRYSILRASELARLRKVTQDIEATLQHLSAAYIRHRECDALEGLSIWTNGLQELLANQVRAISEMSASSTATDSLENGVSSEVVEVPAIAQWMDGAILQSKGYYELAANEYAKLLDQCKTKLAVSTIEFLIDQTADCYARLADWDALDAWLLRVSQLSSAIIGDKIPALHCNVDYLRALKHYDRQQYAEASGSLDLLNLGSASGNVDSFAPLKCLERSEQLLLRALLASRALSGPGIDNSAIQKQLADDLKVARSVIEDSIRVTAADSLLEAHPFLVQLHSVSMLEHELPTSSGKSALLSLPTVYSVNPSVHEAGLCTKIMRVCAHKHMRKEISSDVMRRLSNTMAKLARKQFNYRLAHRLHGVISQLTGNTSELFLDTAFEETRLSFAEGNKTEAAIRLWDLARTSVPREDSKAAIVSRMFLKLAEWLRRDRSDLNGLTLQSRMVLQAVKGDSEPDLEALSGACLEQATHHDPLCAEAWFAYGSWCYRQGHKVVEQMTNTADNLSLSKEETYRISIIVSKHDELHNMDTATQQDFVTELSSLYTQYLERYLQEQQSNIKEELIEALRVKVSWATDAIINDLVHVWHDARGRLFRYYQAACHAYFKFLHLRYTSNTSTSTSKAESKKDKHTSGHDSEMRGTRRYDENITATLRLLRLLVKYGSLLQEVLSEGFRTTPPSPWKDVVPQLFARLDHPDPYVQQQVLDLICKIGEESPHVIVYPAVVGHAASSSDLEQRLFTEIVTKLSARNLQLVEEVRSLISELNRMTIIWEEEWISALQMMQFDVSSRLRKLRDEISRVRANERLEEVEKLRIISEKYTVIMKPPVVQLERLLSISSAPPQTPHEASFQKAFLHPLTKAIDNFRSPVDPSDPDSAWAPLKDLYSQIRHYLKATLNLKDISPKLLQTRCSIISMPGLHDTTEESDLVTIQAFEPAVAILPTKTKPKKIKLIGSDGKRYAYLLKGREDLHLDERIMQFLAIVNQQLRSDRQSFNRDLRARNYAVIPISRRSGLIQWVEGAIPLYSVFKQWQMRLKARQPEITIPKPTDMFYAKLLPALKERGVSNIMSRREWPADVLKKVFLQLVKETPRAILAQELWCSSTSPAEWWKKTCVYNRSVAVSSMIGYTIGLGDRHLDNILMDFSSGEVVHIDYNVCFEKGLQLKVPERVPFRMTQNMQEALGLTGPEGNFRTACEHVLRVMRKNKETLLTLLEAFVYDPLIDWAADKADDVERRNLELHVSLSLFASRVEEMESVLRENRDKFCSVLSDLGSAISSYLHWRNESFTLSAELKDVHQRREELKEALTVSTARETELRASSETETATERVLMEDLRKVLDVMKKAHNETRAWQERFTKAIKALRGDILAALKAPNPVEAAEQPLQVLSQGINLLFSITTPSVEEHKLKHQCVDVESKLNALLKEHAILYHCTMVHVTAYRQWLLQLPPDYYMLSTCARWASMQGQLINYPRKETFIEAEQLFASLGPTQTDADHDRQKLHSLEKLIEDLERNVAQLENTVPSDDFHPLESSQTAAEQQLLDYAAYSDKQHNAKGQSEPVAVTLAAHVATLLVMARWLSTLEAFNNESDNRNDSLEQDELVTLFDDDSVTLTAERLMVYCNRIDYMLHILQRLWAYHSETIAKDIAKDGLHIFADLLTTICQLPEMFRQTATLARADNPEAYENNVISVIAASASEYEAEMREIKERQLAHADLLANFHHKVNMINQRLVDISDQHSDNLSWEEAAELERQQDEERDKLEDLNTRWNQREDLLADINRSRVETELKLEAIEHQFQRVVHSEQTNSVVMALHQAFAQIQDKHAQLQAAMRAVENRDSAPEACGLLAQVGTNAKELFVCEKVKIIHTILTNLHQTHGHDMERLMEETGQSFVETYHRRVFVPAMQYMLSRFVQAQSTVMSREVAPGSIRSTALISVLDKRGQQFNATHAAKTYDLVLDCIKAHKALFSAQTKHKRHREALSWSKSQLNKCREDLVQFRWVREDSLRFGEPLPAPNTPTAMLALLHSCPPGLSPPLPSRAQILVDMKNTADLLATTEGPLQSCEKAYTGLENDLSQLLSQMTPSSSRHSSQMAQLQAFLESIRKRRQNLASLHDKRNKLVRLCYVIQDFEAARWQLPESIRAKHAPIVTHYQQVFTNLQTHRLALGQVNAQLEQVSSEKNMMSKSNAELSTKAEVLGSRLRALEKKSADIRANALKAQEATEEVQNLNAELMGEVLSLLASIVRLTEGLAGVEDIHASAEGLLSDQKTLQTELTAFLQNISDLLSNQLNNHQVIPTEPFLIIVSQCIQAVEYLFHQCIATGSSFKAIAGAHTEEIEHNPRAEEKKEDVSEAAPPLGEPSHDERSNSVYDEDEDEEDDDDGDEEDDEDGDVADGNNADTGPRLEQRTSPRRRRPVPERRFPSFTRLPIDSWLSSAPTDAPVAPESSSVTNAPLDPLTESTSTLATLAPQQSRPSARTNIAKAGPSLGQERNVHAVAVLKRVKAKLEGKDSSLQRQAPSTTNENGGSYPTKLSVPRQVELVIQQATNPDLLSQMYEGWTSWI